MGKLKVSEHLLLQALFPDQHDLRLQAAEFDHERGLLVLDITGPTVPEADEIVATIHVQPPRTTTFKATA